MVFGKMDAYGKFGSLPAAWLAGIMYERLGFYAPFYVQVGVCLFVALLMLGLREPDKI
jgi:predicted MFS family arabinose efflux permease